MIIRGLPPVATEGNIRGLFGREWIELGRVSFCVNKETGKSKGYALADVKDLEQAKYAKQCFNGFNADGAMLGVDIYKNFREPNAPPDQSWGAQDAWGKGGGNPNNVAGDGALFVGGLSFRAEESDLRAIFEKNGFPAEKVTVAMDRETGKSKGYAFVELVDPSKAPKAVTSISGQELCGRPITVEVKGAAGSTPRPQMPAMGGGCAGEGGENCRLFVGGVSFTCSEDQLKEEFESIGKVASVRIVMDRDTGRPKGFGFVEFAHPEDVQRAMRKMQGAEICGKTVRLAMPTQPQKGITPSGCSGGCYMGDKGCGKGVMGGDFGKGGMGDKGAGKGPGFKGMSADRRAALFGNNNSSPSRSPSKGKRKRSPSKSRKGKKRRSSSSSS